MIGDNLRSLQILPALRSAEVMTVTALGDDPREVVVSDGSDQGNRSTPCLASYDPRRVGDQVLVVQLAGADWLVMGSIGQPRPPVTYGVGAPTGGGWRISASAYVRDEADGTRSIYLDTAGSVPLPATISTSGSRGWLANTTTTSDLPRAGAVSDTQGDWSGGWFYGSAIAVACSGNTVAGMTVRVARTAGGRNGPTLLRLGLHNSTGLPVPLTNTWTTSLTLSRNGSAEVDIPASQRSLLASGTVTGIGVWGTGTGEYAEYAASADVTITFG